MRWKVAIAAIGAVAAAGATLMAMSPQSGGAKAGPPVVRPSEASTRDNASTASTE